MLEAGGVGGLCASDALLLLFLAIEMVAEWMQIARWRLRRLAGRTGPRARGDGRRPNSRARAGERPGSVAGTDGLNIALCN
jgi:hypothetical protein